MINWPSNHVEQLIRKETTITWFGLVPEPVLSGVCQEDIYPWKLPLSLWWCRKVQGGSGGKKRTLLNRTKQNSCIRKSTWETLNSKKRTQIVWSGAWKWTDLQTTDWTSNAFKPRRTSNQKGKNNNLISAVSHLIDPESVRPFGPSGFGLVPEPALSRLCQEDISPWKSPLSLLKKVQSSAGKKRILLTRTK